MHLHNGITLEILLKIFLRDIALTRMRLSDEEQQQEQVSGLHCRSQGRASEIHGVKHPERSRFTIVFVTKGGNKHSTILRWRLRGARVNPFIRVSGPAAVYRGQTC